MRITLLPNAHIVIDGQKLENRSDQELSLVIEESKTVPRKYKKTALGRFARHASLAYRAITTGVWSTGAPVTNIDQVMKTLALSFAKIQPEDYKNLTPKTLSNLQAIKQRYRGRDEVLDMHNKLQGMY